MNTEQESSLTSLAALAIEHHLAGRVDVAETCYRQVLASDDSHGNSLHGLGIIEWQNGHIETAHQHLLKAADAHRGIWRYSCTLGRFLTSLGRHSEAILAFERAKCLQPESVDAWFGLASALHIEGRLEESVSAYRQVIILQPDNVEAFNNIGVGLDCLGHLVEAVTAFRNGLALNPEFVSIYSNLGNTLLKMGLVDEAIETFRRGVDLDANSAKLWFNYGNALALQCESLKAIDAYRHALAIEPEHIKALVNLANTLRLRGELNEALANNMHAIKLAPHFYDAYNNAGVVLCSMGRIDEAISVLTQAVAIEPELSSAYNNLGNVYKNAGRLDDAIESYRCAVELDKNDTEAHSNLIYTLCFHPAFNARTILAEVNAFASKHCPTQFHETNHLQTEIQVSPPNRRIRIGYVSPDFRNHCQSMFTIPLLSNHDHEHFEVYCYAQLSRFDEYSERLASYADVWRLTNGKSDSQLAQIISNDGIDILIDLTMHMANGRPLVFARKPAPVQVAWLAYPGTTGIPAMDYRLTDPWLDPPELDDTCYTETSIRLSDTFWCYDPLDSSLQPNALPALTNNHVSFGCLNNFCKVSDDTLRRWGQVMAHVPKSHLVLLAPTGVNRQRVYDLLGQYGVTNDRIECVEYLPRTQYLQTYNRIDLCLDTLPYNGHTTSLDAYWMGVPVVTQVGSSVVGRAGWSQLNNLGLSELAAFNDRTFIDIAVVLATDLSRLSYLRKTLRYRMETSPLMDGKRFAGAVEAVYRQIRR